MNNIKLFNVSASIPPELTFLETLSRNLWWCWNHDAIELFRRIDPKLWKDCGHNPINFLNQIPQAQLEALREDDSFLSHQEQVMERFENEILQPVKNQAAFILSNCVAYFSLEYGIHESLKIYAGGLGCLAGDHLKSASDFNLPLVGVGLFYRQAGYQQYLNDDGWQQEAYLDNEIHRLPLKKVYDNTNKELQVSLSLPEGKLLVIIWRIDVGQVPLYLLDANIPENPPEFRKITSRLYDDDRQTRLRQELLLGIGGYNALLAMGYNPPVCHMNEGHAAFLCMARLAYLMKSKGIDLDTVLEIVPRTNIFTTHTPVPAGNEHFSVELLKPHLTALQKDLGLDPEQVIAWGQAENGNQKHELSMTILGLKMAKYSNGVSQLHGRVERKMWGRLWPECPEDEIPIGHITNGVHLMSWLSGDNVQLFDKYLGPEWRDNPSDKGVLSRVAQIPNDELWRAHELGRARLIRMSRELGEQQYMVRNAARSEIAHIKSILNYDVLTIGFARRFATYKRATLLLKDLQRLEALLTNKDHPVQIIFAGKAHPADNNGKDMIRQIVHFAKSANVRQRIVFLENYDIRVARYLVQGVDVWLNTPRRPLEASGTSGMKAAVNGGLHVSTLDGWWDEGYSPECGWAIGQGEEYDNPEHQDITESQALYNLLENEIVPCFYERSDGDFPSRWTKMMKASIKMSLKYFTSHRMLSEYNSRSYKNALAEYQNLLADNFQKAKTLVKQRARLSSLWDKVKVGTPDVDKDIAMLHAGDKFNVTALVQLGELEPDEIDVEVYYGPINSEHRITESYTEKMVMAQAQRSGKYIYKQELTCKTIGRYGFTARVTPHGPEWKGTIPGFITWANG